MPAMRAIRLLPARAAAGEAIGRSGTTGRFVETYPAATLSVGGVRRGATKGQVGARLIELESISQKTAAAIRGVELPERTASRLRRVLEEDRLTETEPDG